MSYGRKWHEIDLMTLHTDFSAHQWNHFLTTCVTNEDVTLLEKTYYGIQIGMDSLAKQKLNTPKMVVWVLRLQKSIENTVKVIYRQKFPSRLDDPITAKSLQSSNPAEYKKQLQIKRNRDIAYEQWLRRVAF